LLPRRHLLISALAQAAASAAPRSLFAQPLIIAAGDATNRRFALLYEGDKVGTHTLRSLPAFDQINITTDVEITVKRFFVTVFSYRHHSEESWRSGRLTALHSETTEGGKTFGVTGAAGSAGFRVVGNEGPFVAPAAALTSNCLWTPVMLRQETVIDAQHGGVIGLSVTRLADEQIVVRGRSMATTRFRIITPDLAGTLWYDNSGQWVRGEVERYGATLEYRLEG
jgi:Family of unknown function (DUF6134)